MAHLLAPSLLAADFANLQRDVELVNASDAHWFHLDVMDGVFVPNISFGMPVMEAIARHATKPLDVHLMIVDPDRYIQTFADLGADVLTVHAEACTHLHRTLNAIRKAGMKAGVALNPHTPVEVLRDVALELDLVCLMSVNPGFGGQSFIERTSSFRASNPLRFIARTCDDVSPAIDLCFVRSGVGRPPKTVAAASPPRRMSDLESSPNLMLASSS